MKQILGLMFLGAALLPAQGPLSLFNQGRPVMDAHNCYPEDGQWADRIDRALAGGFPVGIEQDLAWYADPGTGKGRAVLSHRRETNGSEPEPRAYFFEKVRPIVERALKENDRSRWPLIIVHFDFKDNRRELHEAIWALLGEYEAWITTAVKGADPFVLSAVDLKPLLVLTEDNDAQEAVFFTRLAVGERLRLFGSAHTNGIAGETAEERARMRVTLPPDLLLSERPTNYRRWWNNSWGEVEEGGQQKAGDWTRADDSRLRALVDHAHRLGFLIRFYTLDGFSAGSDRGWSAGYNFGSRGAVVERWRAAVAAGVDLIATDQYEELAGVMGGRR